MHRGGLRWRTAELACVHELLDSLVAVPASFPGGFEALRPRGVDWVRIMETWGQTWWVHGPQPEGTPRSDCLLPPGPRPPAPLPSASAPSCCPTWCGCCLPTRSRSPGSRRRGRTPDLHTAGWCCWALTPAPRGWRRTWRRVRGEVMVRGAWPRVCRAGVDGASRRCGSRLFWLRRNRIEQCGGTWSWVRECLFGYQAIRRRTAVSAATCAPVTLQRPVVCPRRCRRTGTLAAGGHRRRSNGRRHRGCLWARRRRRRRRHGPPHPGAGGCAACPHDQRGAGGRGAASAVGGHLQGERSGRGGSHGERARDRPGGVAAAGRRWRGRRRLWGARRQQGERLQGHGVRTGGAPHRGRVAAAQPSRGRVNRS
jgi:hypothetical protein